MPKWSYADHAAGKCRAEDIDRHYDTGGDVVELTRLDSSPAGIVRTAVETLLRAAQQSRDLPSAVKAAAALLRYYAPPVAPQQALPKPEDAWPEWMTAERHAYRVEQQGQIEEAKSELPG